MENQIINKENIESEGWKLETDFGYKQYYSFPNSLRKLGMIKRHKIYGEFPNISISESIGKKIHTLFTGEIRNLSELKLIIERIHIK